jgi:hypothetical protein
MITTGLAGFFVEGLGSSLGGGFGDEKRLVVANGRSALASQ